MKNQYVGDIGDYGKYGLLRFIAAHNIRIGINWYLTEDDGSSDGKYINYLNKADDRIYDPELFDFLKMVAFQPDKTVKRIEEADLIAQAEYFHEALQITDGKSENRKWNRRLWFNNSNIMLGSADLIFADPDNGITFSKKETSKDCEKYILPQEITEYYHSGRDVLFYCHRGRRKEADWNRTKTRIREYIRDAQILIMTYHRGTQRSFIFVVHPDRYRTYAGFLNEFHRTEWGRIFTRENVTGNVLTTEEEIKWF